MQSSNTLVEHDSFRDHLGIITDEGKRKVVYPKKPNGKFYNARTIFSLVLLAFLFGMPLIKVDGHPFMMLNIVDRVAFLFGMPLIKVDGHPFMMLNIVDRKFIIFGQMFGTHDFFILALSFITLIVSIILFTAVFGRVVCGWACPQTVLLEMGFRKIEFFI